MQGYRLRILARIEVRFRETHITKSRLFAVCEPKFQHQAVPASPAGFVVRLGILLLCVAAQGWMAQDLLQRRRLPNFCVTIAQGPCPPVAGELYPTRLYARASASRAGKLSAYLTGLRCG